MSVQDDIEADEYGDEDGQRERENREFLNQVDQGYIGLNKPQVERIEDPRDQEYVDMQDNWAGDPLEQELV